MVSDAASFKRDGVTTLINLAKTLCRIVNAFAFVIEAKYSDKPAIMALLTACRNLCDLLPAAQDEFYDPQGENEGMVEDPTEIPGIDPGAPLPPALPE